MTSLTWVQAPAFFSRLICSKSDEMLSDAVGSCQESFRRQCWMNLRDIFIFIFRKFVCIWKRDMQAKQPAVRPKASIIMHNVSYFRAISPIRRIGALCCRYVTMPHGHLIFEMPFTLSAVTRPVWQVYVCVREKSPEVSALIHRLLSQISLKSWGRCFSVFVSQLCIYKIYLKKADLIIITYLGAMQHVQE